MSKPTIVIRRLHQSINEADFNAYSDGRDVEFYAEEPVAGNAIFRVRLLTDGSLRITSVDGVPLRLNLRDVSSNQFVVEREDEDAYQG